LLVIVLWLGLVRSGINDIGLIVNDTPGEITSLARPAPLFSAKALDGTVIDISQMKGKVLMIDFWSSWCKPCESEAPILSRTFSKYPHEDIAFVGIAIWDKTDDVEEFLDKFDSTYPTVIDKTGVIAIRYGVIGIPEKYFIDRNGSIVAKYIGPINEDTLKQVLDSMIQN